MLLKTACPRCNQSYQVSGDRQGQTLKCKKCGETFTLAISTDATPGPPPQADGPAVPQAMDLQPLRPGQRLGGYAIVRKLGAGGMGEVWLAHDTTLERPAAIKILPREFSRDELRLARFLREAKAAARLDHPNTATVYQAGVDQGLAFIAMQYIDGGSLDDAVQHGRPMPWREATKVICDAAKGLAAAHQMGIVHRDVKPSNLMLTSGGTTKVVDFGLARALEGGTQLTQQSVLLGTPAYMAPELWMNQEADPRSDVYALACTYYHLLTGQPPFEGTNAPTLGYQHRYELFPDARQICPQLPEGVCRVLARAAAKDQNQRYPTATEMVAELEVLLLPSPSPSRVAPTPLIAAPQVRPPVVVDHSSTANRPKRKRPAVVWCAGGAALLAVVLFGSIRGAWNTPQPQLLTAPFTATEASQAQQAWADFLAAPTQLRDSAGLTLILIPPGEFEMGSTPAERGRITQLFSDARVEEFADETLHRVRITRPFYLAAQEVTVGQFRRFVQQAGYLTEAEKDGRGGTGWNESVRQFEGPDPKYDWQSAGFTQSDDHPVVNVTWNDAQEFCDWLSGKEGKEYGLPTEAEWEYACRAGTTTAWEMGDDPEALAQVGNVADGTAKARFPNWTTISGWDGYAFTCPAGRFQANRFGLFDMHGNVWEWCSDWYDSSYYTNSPAADPSGALSGSHRVIRGGAWNFTAGVYRGGRSDLTAKDCRSAKRDKIEPSYRAAILGFRVALSLPSK